MEINGRPYKKSG